MFRKVINLSPFVSHRDKNGLLCSERVVDPYASKEFMRNRFGWLSSDISLLMSSQTQQIADNIMSRLQVLQGSGDKRSYREMLDTLVPRYCQSYAERAAFMDYVHEHHPDFFVDAGTNKETKEPIVEPQEGGE